MFYDAIRNDHGLPIDPFKAIVCPRPIGWISSLSPDGTANLAPFSFFNAMAESPHYVSFCAGESSRGIRQDSHTNIEATGEFVVNLATWELREKMNMTSAEVSPGIDEFELAGLAKAASHLVKVPRVAESPVALECRYHTTLALPDDDGSINNNVIFGRVIGIHIDDRFIQDGRVQTVAMRPIARMGYSEYIVVSEAFRMRRPD